MQEDNNNPFQGNQDQAVPLPPDNDINIAPVEEPVGAKKPQVALDGVSPNYGDYNEPQPTAPMYDANSQPMDSDLPVPEDSQTPDATMPYPEQPVENADLDNLSSANSVNPLFGRKRPRTETIQDSVPELANSNETAIEINPKNGLTFKAWQFFLVLAIAIIGTAGTVFFLVEYNQINSSLQSSLSQLEEYRDKADTADKATQQLENLQSTVRDQAEKITTLQEENDSLKKVKDELKTLQEKYDKVKATNEELVLKCASLLAE